MRIAMWSGPRNLSTAMMYSFAARGDCAVWDEPFYAPYLSVSGADHPMAEQIIAAHDADPESVARRCAEELETHVYMKHMPHHMLPGFPLEWAEGCVNIHLIRHPARVIASYDAKRGGATAEDVGFHRQLDIFERFPGPVIDSADIRENPAAMLARLCAEIGLSFTPAMLHWPAGPRDEDGIWAKHWYGAVHASIGFAPAEGALPVLGAAGRALMDHVMPAYDHLARYKLRA